GIATQLAKAICACRFEANQNRKTISHFERGRDLSRPTVAAGEPLQPHDSGFISIWNWRARDDGNVASSFGATDPRLEAWLVGPGPWDGQRNSCFGGKMFRCRFHHGYR